MTLREWFEKIPKGQKEKEKVKLAAHLKCSVAMVGACLAGRNRFSLDKCFLIEKYTNGEVPVSSWIKKKSKRS